jgi:hypothetical protein
MILTDMTFDMHHVLHRSGTIREATSGWMGALSRLVSAGVAGLFLRQVKFASPGAYRMPIRRPNPPAEKLEYTAQRNWLTACNPLLHPLSMMGIETGAEFFKGFSAGCP